MKATFLEVAQHWVNLARIAEREYGEQTQANERVKDQATSDPAMDWQPPRGKRGER